MKLAKPNIEMEIIAEKINVLIKSAATFRRALPEKISFISLNCLDLVLTIVAVENGLYEINHLFRVLLGYPVVLITVKILLPILIAWLIPGKLLLPAIIFLSLVVIWDIKELIVFLI